MPFTALVVNRAKAKDKPYKLSDEQGLYLLINPKGGKYWRLQYRYGGKEKAQALGVYPDVSLAKAREKRQKSREQLAEGIDPSVTKRLQKLHQYEEEIHGFESIAREWLEIRMIDKSAGHRSRTICALEKDLFPQLGRRPVNQVTAPELLMALRKIEGRGAIEIAHRAKQIAGQVFRYAIATGRAERDPSADLKGALKNPVKRQLAAITGPKEVGKLMVAIDGYAGTASAKTALLLSPLLFVRPGELRHMEWSEINWEEGRWELAAKKMKMKQPHIVPLPRQAVEILAEHHKVTGRGKYVFPSVRGASRPLSENGVRTALMTLGYDNNAMTPHGFRAMARTILDEVLSYRVDWIEHQLAHAVKGSNGRAYNRTAHLDGRKEMMQGWADYLDSLRVTALSGEATGGRA